jgi:hypothetical protein
MDRPPPRVRTDLPTGLQPITASRKMRPNWCVNLNRRSGGSIFRFAMIPPENPNMTAAERERTTAQLFAQMDVTPCLTNTSRHPGMHKTRTIDYVVLLSGEVTMLLDKGEVELKPFDVVVQRGIPS